MKICYKCDFENFDIRDTCGRCGESIIGIKHEMFNIAGFIKQNFQLYVIFGVLVALYEYLDKDHVYVKIFPLLIALYLILHLVYKGLRVTKSNPWLPREELIRRESSFQYLIFSIIHICLILALVITLFESLSTNPSAQNYMGFILGMFLFILYFSANYTYEQTIKTTKILLWAVFAYEVAVMLVLIIPILSKITDNFPFFASIVNNTPSFPTIYTGIFQIFLYLGCGGFLAYGLITVFYNAICKENIPFFTIFSREQGLRKFLFLDIVFGIILILLLIFIQQIYALL